MPGIAPESSPIAWLKARLADKRGHIMGLLQRLTGLGAPGSSLKPALFAKFTDWLDEVAAAKNEEILLLARIETIEQNHHFLRRNNKLKQAAPPPETADSGLLYEDDCDDDHQAKARRPFSLMWLLVFWYLFMRQKINHKKQDLTVN